MPPVSRNEKEKNHVHCTRHSFSHVLCKVCNQQLRLCNEGHFIHVDGNLCEQNINFNYLYIFECIHVHLQFEYSITFNNNFYLSMPLVLLEDIYEHSRASVSREEARFFFGALFASSIHRTYSIYISRRNNWPHSIAAICVIEKIE